MHSLVVSSALVLSSIHAARAACGMVEWKHISENLVDMRDMDKKMVHVHRNKDGMFLTIENSDPDSPHWKVVTEVNDDCSATVDFNVPNKPNPPPVGLTASLWVTKERLINAKLDGQFITRPILQFSDHTGTLTKDTRYPLNQWVGEPFFKVPGPKPFDCFHASTYVFADMHDGDQKEIILSDDSVTIKPSGNNQKWVVKTKLDRDACSANVDFNVPGKPNPPPVNLSASLLYAANYSDYKTEWEFTDPSGTLAAKDFPLNRWVELEWHSKPFKAKCLGQNGSGRVYQGVFADMHDGDKKEIIIDRLNDATSLTIKPSGNNQTWIVTTKLDMESCTANVNFNVPGKPNPPPVSLLASFLHDHAPTGVFKYEVEFTDPSATLAPADIPLNDWVELDKKINEIAI